MLSTKQWTLLNMDSFKREIINHYMDMAGFVTVDRDPDYKTTMNGLFETGFAIAVYDDLGIKDEHDHDSFYDTVKACQDTPGVYNRYPAVDGHPVVKDPNSRDDAAGVVTGSVLCNLEFHHDIAKHWIWADNTDGAQAGFWALRARFVSDVIWYWMINKEFRILSPLLMLILAVKLIVPSTDYNVIIDYMKVHTMSKDSRLWNLFKRKVFMKRALLIRSVGSYFGIEHPLVNLTVRVVNK